MAALIICLGVEGHWTDPIVVTLRGSLAGGAAMVCGAVGRPRRLLI